MLYYENKLVKLYHGDCLQIMPKLTDKFDCCIADVPYGTTACKWDNVISFQPMWANLKRKCVLIEQEEKYCQIAKKRLEKELSERLF